MLTFNTAASQAQTPYISLCGRLTTKLITCQVAVEQHTTQTYWIRLHIIDTYAQN